ncbi:MAG: dihydroorotate dehydrogenase-like protein [Anaerolineae bacterium]|nr:dihydroorotate dehydrogenase-like protein [Anaerolineae bacterium]
MDLKATYLGLNLKSPLVASASVLSKKLENIRKMEDTGLGAVVLYSLFEEEVDHESIELNYFLNRGTESFPEAITYFPDLNNYTLQAEKYINLIREAKKSVSIPVIASLNGVSTGGWVKYARRIEEAGADALELNLYYVASDAQIDGQNLERAYLDVINAIRAEIQIPLAVKLSPFFTSLPNFLQKISQAGVRGAVLFNRFYQPDLEIESLEVQPHLELSASSDLLLPLRWIAISHGRLPLDLALSSGVHNGRDMVKAIMAGASVVMVASELVAKGIPRAAEMLQEFEQWIMKHDYASVNEIRGILSQKNVASPAVFERANYMKALRLFDDRF